MYFGESIQIVKQNPVKSLEESFNFFNTVSYNEYLNRKQLLESTNGTDLVLESQVQVLYEVSIKDIWNKIVEAFRKLFEFIKQKAQQFKDWIAKKKAERQQKKTEKAVKFFEDFTKEFAKGFGVDFDDFDDDFEWEKDFEFENESSIFDFNSEFLNEVELENDKDRNYLDDKKNRHTISEKKKVYAQKVKDLANFVDSLKDKKDLRYHAYTLDGIKGDINDKSEIESYISRICNNETEFINSIITNNGLTEIAIKDILFTKHSFEYENGKIKFNGWTSGNDSGEIKDIDKMKRSQIVRYLYELEKEEERVSEYLAGVMVKLTTIMSNITRILGKNKLANSIINKYDSEGAKEAKETRENMTKEAFKALNCIYNITTQDLRYISVVSDECLRRINYCGLYTNKLLNFLNNIGVANTKRQMIEYH